MTNICLSNSTLCAPFFLSDNETTLIDNIDWINNNNNIISQNSPDAIIFPKLNLTKFLLDFSCKSPSSSIRYHQSYQCNSLFQLNQCQQFFSSSSLRNTTLKTWRQKECLTYLNNIQNLFKSNNNCEQSNNTETFIIKRITFIKEIENHCSILKNLDENVVGVEDDFSSCGFGRPSDYNNPKNSLAIDYCKVFKTEECCSKIPFSAVYGSIPDSTLALPRISLILLTVFSIIGFFLLIGMIWFGYNYYKKKQRMKWIGRLKDIQERERENWIDPSDDVEQINVHVAGKSIQYSNHTGDDEDYQSSSGSTIKTIF
jgi:hypothetical protein